MKNILILVLWLLPIMIFAQPVNSYLEKNYDKNAHFIEMRDGVKLHTLVYTPKDKSKRYPFLINRTCYNASRNDDFKIGSPSSYLVNDGYILVYQDCLLYTSPSPRDATLSRMPSSA